MLKSLFSGAFKSPGKFLALCVALYIAAHSIIVMAFVVLAAINHFRSGAKSAPRPSERDSADGQDVETASQQAKRGQGVVARPAVQVPPTPQRQYAKSAVVIPMKARPSSAAAQSLKTGTK
ncbi:hypothetical protein BLA23254_07438 [Burkholderia lata]|uniref:Uncharacterized protein n=1 Tax=Burkholderia lata (strain ATCC 17760 / DSM 23089 / LMG 22485 / NCIMB 9086 / R18194 / 383) TaxID=482957 RepID=A0A6P2SAG4_BURL3|nr:hypothetical protein [Burkholderia lata]VWC46981.1 hypothetical protein BLA23254_07438 [Burkholderia lata]